MRNHEDRLERDIPRFLCVIIYVVVIFTCAFLINTYLGQRTRVYGDSMNPTLTDKDQLLMNKFTYLLSDPQRFDVIIFQYTGGEQDYYIKRVIGLPGETVQIVDGEIYIDGEVLKTDFMVEGITEGKRAKEPIVLGEDEYFVLGDNRQNSKDSRDEAVGNVNRVQILGKASFRIWPLNLLGFIH